LYSGFFECTERRASDAPAGLPQAGRRLAEKIGAGLCCVMLSSISRRGFFEMNLVRKKRRNKRWFIYSLVYLLIEILFGLFLYSLVDCFNAAMR
jgi:hypothetical protein